MRKSNFFLAALLAALFLLAGCGQSPAENASGPQIMTTTTIVGDIVRTVAGDELEVQVLLPVGADPHTFEATPRDTARISTADLIFASGAGLEEFLQPLLENASAQAQVVDLSADIELLESAEADEHAGEGEDEHAGDPHTWMDPNNVIEWTRVIEAALSELDPGNAATYAANAEAYRQELAALDAWIQAQVAAIPPASRLLVSDHTSLTYFARRYGFQQVGAVIPGYSTLAEPSAQELAGLEDLINDLGVQAIFVEEAGSPRLAERVAQDTGARVIRVYIGTLTEGDPAPTYLDLMRYDVQAITTGLTGE